MDSDLFTEVYTAVEKGDYSSSEDVLMDEDIHVIGKSDGIHIIISSPFVLKKEVENAIKDFRGRGTDIEVIHFIGSNYFDYEALEQLLEYPDEYDTEAILQVAEYVALSPLCAFRDCMENQCKHLLQDGETYDRDFMRSLMNDPETAMDVIRGAFRDFLKEQDRFYATTRNDPELSQVFNLED